jgi:hypothetical protein
MTSYTQGNTHSASLGELSKRRQPKAARGKGRCVKGIAYKCKSGEHSCCFSLTCKCKCHEGGLE